MRITSTDRTTAAPATPTTFTGSAEGRADSGGPLVPGTRMAAEISAQAMEQVLVLPQLPVPIAAPVPPAQGLRALLTQKAAQQGPRFRATCHQ